MNNKAFIRATFAVLAAMSLHIDVRADITSGQIGYWSFNENSGSTTADYSGNGNTGTLEFATPGSAWTTASEPTNGGASAIVFNQGGVTTNYVSIANGSSSLWHFGGNPNFTFAAWVNPSVAGASQHNPAEIVIKGAQASATTGNQLAVGLDISGGNFRFQYHNAANNAVTVSATNTTINAGTWYHVVGVYNKTSLTPNDYMAIYINGVSNATSTSTFRTDLGTNNNPVTIGNGLATGSATSYADYFQGTIDDVHIYNRALSPSDVYQLYTNTLNYAPVITTQPRGVTCYLGDSPIFTTAVNVGVTLQPISYQWQFNGTNIAGATTTSLVIANAQATNAGNYNLVISNIIGTVTSSNATLTLNSLPAANFSTGLAGYWKFNDGSGSSAVDSSVNGDTGRLSGFTDTNYTIMWYTGVAGSAVNFNGDGSGLNVVAVPSVGTAAPAVLDFSATGATGNPIFTLAAWVNGSSTQTSGGAIVAKGTGGGGEQYVIDVYGGHYRFYVRDTNGTVFTAQSSIAPYGWWQHVAGVLNGTSGIMNLYVNGQLAAEGVAPFSLLSNTHEMSIGNRQPATGAYGNAFTGILDEVRVYNRDLTSADILALYNSTPVPIQIIVPAPLDIVSGANAQLTATVNGGVPPLSYQWEHNGTNITGATNIVLNLTNAGPATAGSYNLVVSDSGIVPTLTSPPITVTVVPNLTFNASGLGWTTEGGSVSWLGNNTLQLTADTGNEANSAFYPSPLYVGAFQASYYYQCVTGTNASADGITFCLQNDPRGATARGGGGGQLGVGTTTPITPSVELEFNIYANNGLGGVGIAIGTNGAIANVMSTAPVIINNGDTISTVFNYQKGVAKITLTDTNTSAQFTLTTNLNIPALLGTNLAYVGFTGSDGGSKSTQQVSNFNFVSLVDLGIQTTGNAIVLTWPVGVGGYVLQANSAPMTNNWVNVTNAVSIVNGQNQVSVPRINSAQFYQLVLP